MIPKAEELIQLAENQFDDLSDAERKLLQAVGNGENADFRVDDGALNDLANASEWGEERTLRAAIIAWFCTDADTQKVLTYAGLTVLGAKVEGTLNLNYANLCFPLILRGCAFSASVKLERATLKFLDLSGSHLASDQILDGSTDVAASLEARGINVEADVFFRNGFEATGRVSLYGASIGGNLECDNGTFRDLSVALLAENAKIQGSVLLRNGFKANGTVLLSGINIGGGFECERGEFRSVIGDALLAQGAHIQGTTLLRNRFTARGCVSFYGASIGGNLECDNGVFCNPGGYALLAQSIDVKGAVFLRKGFNATGCVSFDSAIIGGNFICDNGVFCNPGGDALIIQNAHINGEVSLSDGFQSTGRASLLGSIINGNLDCENGVFKNPTGDALLVENARIKGFVYLSNGFHSIGCASLLGTMIERNLECTKGIFDTSQTFALLVEKADIKGSVFLNDGFSAKGIINFSNANIDGVFILKRLSNPYEMSLILRFARIRTLSDHSDSWPKDNKLLLDGLVYDRISSNSPLDGKSRLQWLRRQPDDTFSPQPYKQLAQVLQESGREQAATEVLIGKQQDLRRSILRNIKTELQLLFQTLKNGCSPNGDLVGPQVWYSILSLVSAVGRIACNCVLDLSIGYGYRSNRSLLWSLALVCVGYQVFLWGTPELITPSQIRPFDLSLPNQMVEVSENYPKFNAFVYSLDTFVPIVDFHQQKYWLPNPNKGNEISFFNFKMTTGSLLQIYFWFHIAFGWIFSSLWVASFSGLVRRVN